MSEINWKSKYDALKAKFMESVDMAFRLGHEQGQQEALMDQMAQSQQQQADEMAQQSGMQGEGQPGDEQGQEADGQEPPVSAHPGGSELDQHISQLEGMLGKGEVDMAAIIKSVKGFREFQKSAKLNNDLKKSHQAIKGISKAMHKPAFKISQQANHNLSSSAKKAVGMQQKIVEDIMQSWDTETKKVGGDILSQLKVEGVIKE